MKRTELGSVRLRTEGQSDPGLPARVDQETERRQRRERLLDFSLVPYALVFACVGFPGGAWLSLNLPAAFAPSERWAWVLIALAFAAPQFAARFWICRTPHYDALLASGSAELCEHGLWLEKPGLGACALSWGRIGGYAVHPNLPLVRLFLKEEAEEPPLELLAIPTPTEALRGSVLRELSLNVDEGVPS
jgi:hypothetical protein